MDLQDTLIKKGLSGKNIQAAPLSWPDMLEGRWLELRKVAKKAAYAAATLFKL